MGASSKSLQSCELGEEDISTKRTHCQSPVGVPRICRLPHRRARHVAMGSTRHKNMLTPVTEEEGVTPGGLHVSSSYYHLPRQDQGLRK